MDAVPYNALPTLERIPGSLLAVVVIVVGVFSKRSSKKSEKR